MKLMNFKLKIWYIIGIRYTSSVDYLGTNSDLEKEARSNENHKYGQIHTTKKFGP